MSLQFWFWLTLAAILVVMEIFTSGFFLLPFGLGAAAAAVLEAFGVDVGWQWLAFIGVSALALVSLRRVADRMAPDSPIRVGGDRLIGGRGVVIEQLDAVEGRGRVRIHREEWRADAPGFEPVAEGTHVVVERVEGAHLIVRPSPDVTNEDLTEA